MFTRLGEHHPPGPQSESVAQLPDVSQTFGSALVDAVRQMQGLPAQSQSPKHSS
jgi:hypothetical protein